MIRTLFVVAVLFAPLVVVGCESETNTAKVDCDAIAERCHHLDTGSGPIHECHEFAEDPSHTNEQCVAMRESCFAVCIEATDAGSDATP